MNTVVLEAPESLALRDRPAPGAPGPGEARVRVLRVGVCGSDLHAYRGRQAFIRYPVVLGHELAVEVVALGPDDGGAGPRAVRVGDRCAVIPYLADGECQACRAGRTNCCTRLSLYGIHRDGGMCDEMVVPLRQLAPAEDLPLDVLAVAEMLAVGAHAAARARLDAAARVLVLGAGPIGLSTLAFARWEAAETYAIDLDEGRLAHAEAAGLARGVRLPADARVGGTPDDDVAAWVAALRARLDGDLPEVVIDATGSRASMERAPALAAPGGRVVFVGHTPGPLTFANPVLHGKELELVASRNARPADFDTVFAGVRSGRVDPLPWISTRVDPAGFVAAIDAWSRPGSGVVKAIIDWAEAPGGTLAPARPAGGPRPA